jgi:hypothetical protein
MSEDENVPVEETAEEADVVPSSGDDEEVSADDDVVVEAI